MTDYILSLSFDLRQVTQSLKHEFCLLKGGEVCLPLIAGTLAGSYNFQPGDRIIPQVNGYSAVNEGGGNPPPNVFNDFCVNDCTLVSIPARMDQPLSMFDEVNACEYIPNSGWGKAQEVPPPEGSENLKRFQAQVKKPLNVTAKTGQWKLAGYLSVTIETDRGPENRLYFFDPESSSGKGHGSFP